MDSIEMEDEVNQIGLDGSTTVATESRATGPDLVNDASDCVEHTAHTCLQTQLTQLVNSHVEHGQAPLDADRLFSPPQTGPDDGSSSLPAQDTPSTSLNQPSETVAAIAKVVHTKPLPKPSLLSRFRWRWESMVVVINLGYIVALVALRIKLHDKPFATWKVPLEPNTVASILTTIAKTTCLYNVAQILSQYKWKYVKRTKPLLVLDAIDQGSRLGPFSAVRMALKTRFSFVTTLATIIIVTSLIFEMTVQQAFTTRLKRVPVRLDHQLGRREVAQNVTIDSLPASLGVAHDYISSSCSDPTLPSYLIEAQSAIYNGLRSPAGMPFNCPYDSCSWAEIKTLAVCSSCEDVTLKRKRGSRSNVIILPKAPDDDKQISIPDFGKDFFQVAGFSTIPKPTIENDTSSGYPTISNAFGEICGPRSTSSSCPRLPVFSNYKYLAGFVALSVTGGKIKATRCQFQWCEQTQKDIRWDANSRHPVAASVSSRSLRRYLEEEIGINVKLNSSRWIHYTSERDPVSPSSISQERVFKMDAKGESSLSLHIGTLLSAFVGESSRYGDSACAMSDGIGAYMRFADANIVAQNIATSLTNAIRGKENLVPLAIQGMGYKDELYLYVRLSWFIPSMVIILLSIVLLGYMVYESWSENLLFKSSILAFYFYGLEGDEDVLKPLHLKYPEQLEKIASTINVSLSDIDGRTSLRME